jgi:TolB-like protein/DNA-binding winged helix-turn-helix (wHTH) protein/Flp pilus assembly protein TadD
MQPHWKYRFGPFELEAGVRKLSKNGVKVTLLGQPYLVLEALLFRAGEVVSREEIREKLWPADVFVDFEHGLNTSVKKLRQALCDSADEPRYIETVPRLGYRFIGPVECVTDRTMSPAAPAADPEQVSRSLARNELPSSPSWGSRWTGAALGLALAVVLGGALIVMSVKSSGWVRWPFGLPHNESASHPTRRLRSIAVMPLVNLSNDPAQEYFTDGMTDELISDLAQLGTLRVISRTSVLHYKGGNKTALEIGRELAVDALVEGTVQRVENKVRIRVQLIDAASDRHLWARSYDHELKDVLLLQTTAAHDIVGEIRGQVDGTPANMPSASELTVQPAAYDLYLKGQYFWNKRTVDGFQQAIMYFERATAKDPHFGRAYAGLADCYALLGPYSGVPQTEFMRKARAAALKALEIDDNLAEAHTALGLIVQNYDWDWSTAEREFRRAIELNPNYATAHQFYAEHLAWRGRFEEALRESERARELDPLSMIIATDNGAILYVSRQYERAVAQLRSVREMDPTFEHAEIIVYPLVEQGMFTEALADLDRGQRMHEDDAWVELGRTYVYGRSGQTELSRRGLEKLREVDRHHGLDTTSFVFAYIALGEKEQSLAWLEKAYSQHSNLLTTLKVDPVFDPLRDDSRFEQLLHRVGLAQ